ncbi:MAG: prolipoprotein diacylglyceryl transferase [Deltaproteobacteria bacterium]|nr:prolipoprotein diacylglyceryl transferase [Deltaproteobacteria bacterium]
MSEFSSLSLATSGFLPWIEIGPIRIQSYFVVISIVLSAIAFWIPRRAVSLDYSPRRALDLYIAAMIFGFVGARLFHILWEEPRYYIADPLLVFDILGGGFVWYGGAIGGMLGLYLILRRDRPSSIGGWLDLFAPIAAVGYGAGRIACLLTGCCYGAVCELPHWLHSHGASPIRFMLPTQAFAIIWEFGAAFVLHRAEGRRWAKGRQPGQLFSLWLVLHGLGRMLMELMRADPRGPSAFGVTVSMVMSLILILVGGFFLRTASGQLNQSGK